MRISPRQSIKFLKSRSAGKSIGFLFLAIGLCGLIYAAKVTLDERAVKNWLPHTAQIQSARLETHVNDDGDKSYSIDVAYRFDWKGTTYAGSKYRLHDKSTSNFAELNDVVEDLLISKNEDGRYPIFVNPNNPRQSTIRNIVHPGAKKSGLFLGILFSLIGYFTAFKPSLFRNRNR